MSFLVNSFLLFYFFFEVSLIPIFLILLGWGYQIERFKSRFFLLFYTIFASLPLLVFILYYSGSIGNSYIVILSMQHVYRLLSDIYLLLILLSFITKFPMYIFHL